MKTLKLDHQLAIDIKEGRKSSTWRMYDDKDLSVNDEVRLLDKVDPERPETWKAIGTARINSIVQKRLGDIGAEDYEGHDRYNTVQSMLDTYRKFYGGQVSLDTPIKIIRFYFNNDASEISSNVVKSAPILTEAKLFTDGGSRGNPGPSASGFAMLDMNDKVVVKKGIYLGVTTNNQAEYQALKFGLEEAARMKIQDLQVYMDSLLVVNQMLGIFKVKNRDLWPIHAAIKELSKQFAHISFTHVPRALNKIADSAVNEALDEAAKK